LIRGFMSNEEWAFFAPFVFGSGPKRGRPPKDHRLVLDGVFLIARTGVQWRDLPDFFGNWSSVYREFRRWTQSGLWDLLLEALNGTEAIPNSLQMINSTIVRPHHCAAGAKRGLRDRALGARKMASRPRFISASTPAVCP
jgi:transposase